MAGFDLTSLGLQMYNKNREEPIFSAITNFNAQLHSSKLYNGFQITVSALAVFSGGYSKGMGERACFVAGTMIHTVAGLVAIENIKVGDKVISTNTETFETREKSVVRTFINESKELVRICVNGEEIVTTTNHPFYVKDKGWIPAASLVCGTVLLLVSGKCIEVETINFETVEEPVKVYNFEVEGFHTYYVGSLCVLVHNLCEFLVKENGDIEITDWGDYPEGYPKPDGPMKLIDGPEYEAARNQADNANRQIHRANPSLKGLDIHEIQPVKFGGSPTNPANKIPLSRSEHAKFTSWFKSLQSQLENQ